MQKQTIKSFNHTWMSCGLAGLFCCPSAGVSVASGQRQTSEFAMYDCVTTFSSLWLHLEADSTIL